MREFKRSERISDLIHREISNMLLRDISDPRISMVTITGTKVSDDLGVATVFFSIIGDQSKWEEANRGFRSCKGFIKRELGRRLKLKYIPDIRFREDRSLETGEKMDKVLSDLNKDDG